MKHWRSKISFVFTALMMISLLSACDTAIHDAIYDDDHKIAEQQDLFSYTISSKNSTGDTDYGISSTAFPAKIRFGPFIRKTAER